MGQSTGEKLHKLSKSCKSMAQVRQILAQIIQANASSDQTSTVANLLSYSATSPDGDLQFASAIFSNMGNLSSFTHNAMIKGFVNGGFPRDALKVYNSMVSGESASPDKFTYTFIFKACALIAEPETGKTIHGKTIKVGLSTDPFIGSGMMNMYSQFAHINSARKLFDEMPSRDIVLWNTMIGGYVKCGRIEPAYLLFEQMPSKNIASYNAILGGLVKEGSLAIARTLFDEMPDRDTISWNTMIGCYARHGSAIEAWELLQLMPERKISTWSALVSGFAQSSRFDEALDGFREMTEDCCHGRASQAALVSAISSCAKLGSLQLGLWLHCYIIRREKRIVIDDFLGASLINMYCKCGFLQGALSLFHSLQMRGVCSWTAMIHGLALHGESDGALAMFDEMERAKVRPNAVTFVALLLACSHGGQARQGREILSRMESVYGLCPKVEHYACMVDLLSRAGMMEEAGRVVNCMPVEADEVIRGAVFSGLAGGYLSHDVMMVGLMDGGMDVLESNVCAAEGRWEAVERVRRRMVESGVRKIPGGSMIEVEDRVHEFLAGETAHPMVKEIYLMLDYVYREMKARG
ncbi:pentatricopeptide repeat-containing protein At4g18840-like [Wolffia australiana]